MISHGALPSRRADGIPEPPSACSETWVKRNCESISQYQSAATASRPANRCSRADGTCDRALDRVPQQQADDHAGDRQRRLQGQRHQRASTRHAERPHGVSAKANTSNVKAVHGRQQQQPTRTDRSDRGAEHQRYEGQTQRANAVAADHGHRVGGQHRRSHCPGDGGHQRNALPCRRQPAIDHGQQGTHGCRQAGTPRAACARQRQRQVGQRQHGRAGQTQEQEATQQLRLGPGPHGRRVGRLVAASVIAARAARSASRLAAASTSRVARAASRAAAAKPSPLPA